MTCMCLCMLRGNLVSRQVLSGRVWGEYYWTLRLLNATGGHMFWAIDKKKGAKKEKQRDLSDKYTLFCQKKKQHSISWLGSRIKQKREREAESWAFAIKPLDLKDEFQWLEISSFVLSFQIRVEFGQIILWTTCSLWVCVNGLKVNRWLCQGFGCF